MELIDRLNAPTAEERLDALRLCAAAVKDGSLPRPTPGSDVNNHIHTMYSFSPYSPTMAVWKAYQAGLSTAGIIDHDSVSGVREFVEAGAILDFPVTCGFELRVTHTNTPLGNRRTNNPDQGGISYLTFHGLPHTRIDAVAARLLPIQAARGRRNRAMCDRLTQIFGIPLNYETDVFPLSKHAEGGSVTERHLLYALSGKLIATYGKGDTLVRELQSRISVSPKLATLLEDTQNPFYQYDLLGLLKGELVEQFYVPADEVECPPIVDMVAFAKEHGIIVTYPYLGDVASSVTGDKKAQTFEDSFLSELFTVLVSLQFPAISYMPSRNTAAQLTRVRAMCDQFSLFQISGEDINTPRQSFVCEAMRNPEYGNLLDNTWALIGHERAATKDISDSFTRIDMPLSAKIKHFREQL